MPITGIFLVLLAVPPDWTPVLSHGDAPVMQKARVRMPAGAAVKWLVSEDCMLFLGSGAEIEILPPAPGECARIRHLRGPLRAAAAGARPLTVEHIFGETRVHKTVFETKESANLALHDAIHHLQGPQSRSFAVLSVGSLMQSLAARRTEESVQTGTAGGSMCLDSSKAAGDVGNSSSSVIQMPPRARIQIRVPLPGGR